MVERDLKEFECPQQFVQFKLALRSAQSSKQRITFSLNKGESANDIERFLQKMLIVTILINNVGCY